MRRGGHGDRMWRVGAVAIAVVAWACLGDGPTSPESPPPGCPNPGVCYVDAQAGRDTSVGDSAHPFHTLQRAADVVTAGDVVIVRDGSYTGDATVLDIARSGTAHKWIAFQAAHRGRAVIDGRGNASQTGIKIEGSYVKVIGFQVRGTRRYGIDADGGHDVDIAQNDVHHVGRYCTSGSGGIAGINAYASRLTIERNVVHDIGRFAEGEGGCEPDNAFWQNHDHGIYFGTGSDVVVRDNLFYDLTHGWAIQRYDGQGAVSHGVTIENNTFAGANPHRAGQIIIASPTHDLLIVNNIFYGPDSAAVAFEDDSSSGAIANNLVSIARLAKAAPKNVTSSGNLVGVDPVFVDPGHFDFHLGAGSPAIGEGRLLTAPARDLDGVMLPIGCAPDLGAFQHR